MTKWNGQQQTIFGEFAAPRGRNLVVRARAGTGKSTTLEEGLNHLPPGRRAVVLAFNRSTRDAMKARVARAGLSKRVDVKTCHGHGFAAVARAFSEISGDNGVNEKKSMVICRALWGDDCRFSFYAISRLVAVAKDTLAPADDHDALDALLDDFDIDWAEGLDLRTVRDQATVDAWRADFVARASAVLSESCATVPPGKDEFTGERLKYPMIDFGDMCWLPIVLDLRVWQYNDVLVDEFQDLSPCQHAMIRKCVRPGGRIVAVGDDRQAIYAFRGADADGMQKFIDATGARVLPLSTTYRCGRAIVQLAQQLVPDYDCPADAHEGAVVNATYEDLEAEAGPGDMVVSRSNAPLIGLCMKFLKAGRRAGIKGRDVGEGIARLVRKSDAPDVASLETWIRQWADDEAARLSRKERDPQVALDKRDCVLALCEGAVTVGQVVQRCDALFTEVDDSERITLGTTHKLKGLEADRVWMLDDTYFSGRDAREAQNLRYVAITRAKRELRIVKRGGR